MKGNTTCLYPGLLYLPGDNIFLQSISNPYLMRLRDGGYLDGKYYGLSRYLFKSTCSREDYLPYKFCDTSWLDTDSGSDSCRNPFIIGQLINHDNIPNVMYYEVTIPLSFPKHLKSFIPNIYHQSDHSLPIRSIFMIALRDISNEELFANYQFIGNKPYA